MTRILMLTFFLGLLLHTGPVRAGDELEKVFANPPESARARCYWWWLNQDLTDFNLRILDQAEKTCVPTFVTIAEDMTYNHGPMISEKHFDEFIAPYYRQIIPRLQEWNAPVIVDTDGDVTQMVPWLAREGISGVLPLMKSGGFIPSVDHQTPPHVTIDQYRVFRRLLDEYTSAVDSNCVS